MTVFATNRERKHANLDLEVLPREKHPRDYTTYVPVEIMHYESAGRARAKQLEAQTSETRPRTVGEAAVGRSADRGLVCLRLLRLSRGRETEGKQEATSPRSTVPSTATICPRQHGANICSG